MRIPTKIKPDRIRDSIVQVFFKPVLPFEPLIGYIHSALTDIDFTYSNASSISQPKPNEVVVNSPFQQLFIRDKVKIQLHPNNSLIFNCTNEYIGWGTYFPIMEEVLGKLLDLGYLEYYSRVGVRYISEFPGVDILDHIHFSYDQGFIKHKVENGSFRLEWQDAPQKVVINISSNWKISHKVKDEEGETVSIIDVDVIQQNLKLNSVKEVGEIIDNTHKKQKIVFFSLLKEEFLKTLNPQYK